MTAKTTYSSRVNLASEVIDFGRIIAASLVYYYHIGNVTHYPLAQWGTEAIVFFIIAAGVVFKVFSSTRVVDPGSYGRYMLQRLKSILPPFVIVNIAIFATSYILPSRLGRPFSFWELFLSCLGLSQYFGDRYLSHSHVVCPFHLSSVSLVSVAGVDTRQAFKHAGHSRRVCNLAIPGACGIFVLARGCRGNLPELEHHFSIAPSVPRLILGDFISSRKSFAQIFPPACRDNCDFH